MTCATSCASTTATCSPHSVIRCSRRSTPSSDSTPRTGGRCGPGSKNPHGPSSTSAAWPTPLSSRSSAATSTARSSDTTATCGLTIPVPNSPKMADLILKRYRPDREERFQLHFDAVNHLANRYLVLLWYLNDVPEGGETRFPQLGITVPARQGRLLVFPPYWMYQHEGLSPRSGTSSSCRPICCSQSLRPRNPSAPGTGGRAVAPVAGESRSSSIVRRLSDSPAAPPASSSVC